MHMAKMATARRMWNDMGGSHTNILDPPSWLYNQRKLRAIYEDALSNPLRPFNMSSDIMAYNKFMYDTFPAGYFEIVYAEYLKK